MPVAKYNPFTPEVDDFPQGVRMFHDAVNRILSDNTARPWTPPVDVLETENELVLKADLPEVDMKDIDIKIENGALALKGERRFERTENQKGFHRIERGYGSFVRYFSLPDTVDAEKVRASLKSGVLTITLPKKDVAKPRSIKVEVDGQ